MRCLNCKGLGQIESDCEIFILPGTQKKPISDSVVCGNCKRKGHIRKECPDP